jgi:hypothetical protein
MHQMSSLRPNKNYENTPNTKLSAIKLLIAIIIGNVKYCLPSDLDLMIAHYQCSEETALLNRHGLVRGVVSCTYILFAITVPL